PRSICAAHVPSDVCQGPRVDNTVHPRSTASTPWSSRGCRPCCTQLLAVVGEPPRRRHWCLDELPLLRPGRAQPPWRRGVQAQLRLHSVSTARGGSAGCLLV